MTLLSNSSMNVYPENKTSSFTVHIPRYVTLTGNWDVALTEMHYPYAFFTVSEGENVMQIKSEFVTQRFIDSKGAINEDAYWQNIVIKPGFYRDIQEIIDCLNLEIRDAMKTDKDFFQINDKTQRVSGNISIFGPSFSHGDIIPLAFKICGRLALQLGFRPDEENSLDAMAPHPTNLNMGIPDIMLIYCDIIEPQIIGDSWSKVLRTVNTSDGAIVNFSQPRSFEFTRLQYVPLQSKQFHTIRIDIRDVAGKLLPFQYGTLSVKLHFKRRLN